MSAVTALRLLALSVGSYERPAQRSASHYSQSCGSRFVKPLDDRLVPIASDKRAHVRIAVTKDFPRTPLTADAPQDLSAAVSASVRNKDNLPEWRASRAKKVRAIAESLSAYGAWLASLSTGTVTALVEGMNLAFLAAFIDAIEWPDFGLVERFVKGFTVVGDIPDSGLFHPVYRPAEVNEATFTPASNGAWLDRVARQLHATASGSVGLVRKALEKLESVTRAEACNGHVKGPYSRKAMDGMFGRGMWRCMLRFGVEQGVDLLGDPKLRAIDNARTALLNAACTFYETIFCMSFQFAAIVAALVFEECVLLGIGMVALTVGLDDMRAAYRRIPTAQPWYCTFAIWSFVQSKVVYYYLPGHAFGLGSAVLNFNRFPHVMVAMARCLFAVMADHYFDDYMIIDIASAGLSGQISLALCHELVGQSLEPKKRKLMSDINDGLGVSISFQHLLTEYAVFVSCLPGRIEKILHMFDVCYNDDWMTPATASSIRGKLGFCLTTAYARVGRAASQPLVQREFQDTSYSVRRTPIAAARMFYKILLPMLPSLKIPVYEDQTPAIVLYTDAMFRKRRPYPLSRLGVCYFDPLDGGGAHHSDMVLPPWVWDLLSPVQKVLIMQAEMLAPLAALFSLPKVFSGRKVILFIDNTGALSALLHGYASKPDCAAIANVFHLLVAYLSIDIWFEWVPSDANICDLPSRLAYADYFKMFPDSNMC